MQQLESLKPNTLTWR